MRNQVQDIEPLLLTVHQASLLLNMGEKQIYRLINKKDPATKRPLLYSAKLGASRRIPRKAILEYLKTVGIPEKYLPASEAYDE